MSVSYTHLDVYKRQADHKMINMMQLLLEKQNTMLCTKFDEHSVKFNELKKKVIHKRLSILNLIKLNN